LIATTPREAEQCLIAEQQQAELQAGATALRMQAAAGWPTEWKHTSSDVRITEAAASERLAGFGRWHLDHQVNVFNSMTSIRSRDVELLWQWVAQQSKESSSDQKTERWNSVQRWLRISNVIHVDAGKPVHSNNAILPRVTWRTVNYSSGENRNRQVSFVSSLEHTPERFKELLAAITKEKASHDMLARCDDPALRNTPDIQIQECGAAASIKIQTDHPKLVVRPIYQDEHWHATMMDPQGVSQTIEVLKVDYLKQGVIVPAGQWTVRFEYWPWWITPTFLIALITWLVFLLNILIAVVGRSRIFPSPTGPALSPDHPAH
ncbi:MAG: hypothetical protein WBD20_17060, partial [Pirellulaceae bacterium]